jgi:predicted nicotinamide N-methyase
MSSPQDDPVLSEVHMESCPPGATAWVTRFCYSLPQQLQHQINIQQQSPTVAPAAAAALVATRHRADDSSMPESDKEELADLEVDADGDLLLLSRPERRSQHISIQHSLATPVSRCGEQVWLGSCLLCDWLLHNAQQLAGKTVLELGAGVGLASIMAAHFAQRVLLTDADDGVLQLAARNVSANGVQDRVSVRGLNWLQLFDTQLCRCSDAEVLSLLNNGSTSSNNVRSLAVLQPTSTDTAGGLECGGTVQLSSSSSSSWVPGDLQQLCAVDMWLAADVVYNETLTDAFMRTAHQLMAWQQQQQRQQQQQAHQGQACSFRIAPCGALDGGSSGVCGGGSCSLQGPRLLVAVEKRYNFTYRDLDARASAFEHFMTYVAPAPAPAPAPTAAAALTGGVTQAYACQQAVQQSVHEAQQQPQQQQQQQAQQGIGAANLPASSSGKPLFSGRRLAVEELPQVSGVLPCYSR